MYIMNNNNRKYNLFHNFENKRHKNSVEKVMAQVGIYHSANWPKVVSQQFTLRRDTLVLQSLPVLDYTLPAYRQAF